MIKILVVYYSRTNTTKKAALGLARELGADIEEIIDTKSRAGGLGYVFAGRDAMFRRLTKLEPVKFNPGDYDLVIIGTPIWSWNVSTPARTYLAENKGKFSKVAFFCTMGGSGDVKAFLEMEAVCDCEPVGTLALTAKDVARDKYGEKIKVFVERIKTF